MSFTHLHVASSYSAHYGVPTPRALVEAAIMHGSDAVALTDRDGLYGAMKLISAAVAARLDPIVGVNLAVTDSKGHLGGRVVVLAHGHNDGAGWAALCHLISDAHHASPVAVTQAQLAEHLLPQEQVVGTVLLGPDSDVGRAVTAGNHQQAQQLLQRWLSWSGAGASWLAIEVVNHRTEPGTAYSLDHAARMLELADSLGVTAVLSNAVRYLEPSGAITADILDSARALEPLDSIDLSPNAQAWLKPPAQMAALAHDVAQAAHLPMTTATGLLDATARLADRCRLDPVGDAGWGRPKVPEASVLGISGDPFQTLVERCGAGITDRFSERSARELADMQHRLSAELKTIEGLGFASYFLTVAEVADLIRSMRVRNAARGSGAGSLVNYLLRISHVDPIEHNLLFERFLSLERSTLPDIDIDVESARRHEVYHAIFKRFGSQRVTLLSMQSTYRARGAVRDAGLALGLPEEQIDHIAKGLWRFEAKEFREALQEKPELRDLAKLIADDAKLELLVDVTQRLNRLPRHISMHPCGVILGDAQLLNFTPVEPSGIGLSMSQFDKDDMDPAGFLKLDVLGVRMQSAMAYAVDEIIRIHGSHEAVVKAGGLPTDATYVQSSGRIDLEAVPKDDIATFQLISSTFTLGCFQIESPGQRELVGKMQPDKFDDLIVDISLFRPGPMKANMVSPYLGRRLGWEPTEYPHPDLREALKDTYGVVVFHEQVIRTFDIFTGCGLARADELRRSLEDKERRPRIEQYFRDKAAARGYDHATINAVWEILLSFSSFGFCRAHGAAFALPTYQSAWLKAHYPAEFFAGLLTHDPGMYPKRLLLTEAKRLSIPILGLDVNASSDCFRVERTETGDLGIRLSLNDVFGMQNKEVISLIAGQPYDSIADVRERAKLSRPTLESLAIVGAFDSLVGSDEGQVGRADIVAHVRTLNRKRTTPPKPPDHVMLWTDERDLVERGNPAMTMDEIVRAELGVLSLDVSEHVLESYRPMLDEIGTTPAAELVHLWSNTEVLVAGHRVATQTPPMRSGKRVVFISLDDGTGCSDAVFFAEAQQRAGSVLFGTELMLIAGTTRRTGDKGVSIQATNAWDLRTLWRQWVQVSGMELEE